MNWSRSLRDVTGTTLMSVRGGALGDDTKMPADEPELFGRLLHHLFSMSGHAASPQDRFLHVHCRVDRRVGVDAFGKQRLPEHQRRVLVADRYRHDRRPWFPDVETHIAQALSPHRPQFLY